MGQGSVADLSGMDADLKTARVHEFKLRGNVREWVPASAQPSEGSGTGENENGNDKRKNSKT